MQKEEKIEIATARCASTVVSFDSSKGNKDTRAVKRLNVLDFFTLGETLGELAHVLRDKARRGPVFFKMDETMDALKAFIQQDTFSLAKDDARELNSALSTFISQYCVETDGEGRNKFKDFNEELDSWTFYQVRHAMEHLTHVFRSECRTAETYFIERKLIYDTAALLRKASEKIHESIRPLIEKDALAEIDESGRCLALEAYTATGFHALRGLELVMDDYYREISKKDCNFRSWADYIEAFGKLEKTREERKSKYPSPKVVSMLDRIRQLDRNPLMHPRDVLDEMSADTLFTISVAAITEMAKDIRDLKADPEQTEMKLVTNDAEREKGPGLPKRKLSFKADVKDDAGAG